MNCNADLISVIVPVYNVEKYLIRCVDSIINQTYKNLEIILVDDGSIDNSSSICDDLGNNDSRISVIHKNNGGLSSARNAGLEKAAGKYITFVDSDDWLELDAIEILYESIITNNCDLSMGRNSRDKITKKEDECLSQKEFLKRLLKIGSQENVMYAWAKLYKKSLFDTIKFINGIIIEDVPCIFEIILKCNKITIVNKILYNYFINKEGITEKEFSKKNFDYLSISDYMFSKAAEYGDEDIINMVDIYKKRSDFGLLFKIAVQKNFNSIYRCYREEIENMLSRLKANRSFLSKQKIPLSRKILIRMFCLNYLISAKLVRIIYK